MNKKTCCGCFGVGCLLVIVAVVVGGYFGLDFLHNWGRESAAAGMKKSVEKITEVAFNETDRVEINKIAAEVAEEVRSGKIGLLDLLSKGTQQLENNMHVKSMLLAFYRQNMTQAEASEGLPVDEAGAAAIKQLIYGISENKISVDQVASITAMIVERYTETTGGEGDGKVKFTVSMRRLKSHLSPEELTKSLDMMKKIAEENHIQLPGPDFDASAVVKSDFLKIFADLRKTGEKNDQ